MTASPTRRGARTARPIPVPKQGVWPDLDRVPTAPMRARIAASLFRRAVRTLPVRVRFPDGRQLGAGGPDSPLMELHRPADFFRRLGADAKIGFGESYMVGDWTSPEVADLLTPFASRMSTLIPRRLQSLRRLAERVQPSGEENTLPGSRENIHRHYDLSNELFTAFLDETMSYSSAWFAPDSTDLVAAQLRKIDGVLDYAGVGQDTHVLEIGTGWGALAIRAAQRGARVTTLTISAEQKKLAEQRVAEAGVADRVQVMLRDYREAQGCYDAVVSVEMIEAVGREYWPTYFTALDRLLKPGGKVALQAITMPHDRMLAAANAYTWIHKYVFPGGLIPSVESIHEAVDRYTGLRVVEDRAFGQDYALTLRLWRKRFLERWDEVAAQGFDGTFRRMWEFYLAYSEAGFRAGYLDVHQLSLSK